MTVDSSTTRAAPRLGRWARVRRGGLRASRRRRARLRRAGFVAGFALLALVLLTVGERLLWWGKVLPGVEVTAVDVTGKSEHAAVADVEQLAHRLETGPLRVRAGTHDLGVDRSVIGFRVDAAATVRTARRAGRKGNPATQLTGTVLRRFRSDDVELQVHFDERALEGVLDSWAHEVDSGLENGGLRFEGTTVISFAPKSGIGLRRAQARRLVEQALRRGDTGVVKLPIGRVKPEVDAHEVGLVAAQAHRLLEAPFTIAVDTTTFTLTPAQLAGALATRVERGTLVLDVDREKLRAALGPGLAPIETPPVDARFDVHPDNTVSVVPSVPGRLLDLDAVSSAILTGNRTIVGQIKAQEPAHDTTWAQKLNITELVSSFTTRHSAGQPRVTNIHKAADVLNNTIVEPGETFSLNAKLGPRTLDKGYVLAPAIAADLGLEDAVGGGVSQVSTTLFNATFFGGYRDVAHTPHAYYIDRYPTGREATLNYPSIDNKFQNDSGSGVLIRTGYSDTSITVSFYGNKEGKTVRAEGPNILSRTPFTTQDVDTPLLFQGDTKEIQKGHDGLRVEVSRIISRPGQPDVRQRYLTTYAMVPQKNAHGTTPPTTTTVPGTPTSSTAPGTPTTPPAPGTPSSATATAPPNPAPTAAPPKPGG